jgi:hypothetical protein
MKFVDSSSRVFTSYEPRGQIDYNLQQKAGIKDMNSYRYYLQRNSDQLMKDFQTNGGNQSGGTSVKNCPVCNKPL